MKYLLPLLLLSFLFFSSNADEDSIGDGFDDLEESGPEDDVIHAAHREYDKGISQLKVTYRANFAKALKHADSAEVFLLSFTMERDVPEEKRTEYIYISPYRTFSKILQRKKIQGQKLETLRNATTKLLQEKSTDGGAFCHYPIHGVRLLRGKRVIFETSLCWKCGNYFLTYPYDERASWIGFSGEPIKQFLDREMPIPQSEIDRFNAKYGKKKKAQKKP